jgi:hypothetical protein
MNCKVGGAAWTVEISLKGTMVVGFVTLNKGLLYGALAASLNYSFSHYFCNCPQIWRGAQQ